MPLYDIRCDTCKQDFEIFARVEDCRTIACPKCGEETRVLITGSSYHSFPEGWWEHIGPKPLRISSRSQLKEECKKNECYATYLDPPISFNERTRVTRSQH